MAAELYIECVFDQQYERFAPAYKRWVKCRDRAMSAEEREHARAQADKYFAKMCSRGYFRDTYNDANLLWQLGLSWWEDVMPLLDKHGHLTPARAKRLLAMLSRHEDALERNLAALDRHDDQRRFVRTQYRKLRALLAEAIGRKEPILCSL